MDKSKIYMTVITMLCTIILALSGGVLGHLYSTIQDQQYALATHIENNRLTHEKMLKQLFSAKVSCAEHSKDINYMNKRIIEINEILKDLR